MILCDIYDYFWYRYGSQTIAPESIDIEDVDFHQLLARDGKIAAIWCIDDVKGIRPDLTDDQAWEVLEEAGRTHDAEYGLCWMTLRLLADEMFPEPTTDGRGP